MIESTKEAKEENAKGGEEIKNEIWILSEDFLKIRHKKKIRRQILPHEGSYQIVNVQRHFKEKNAEIEEAGQKRTIAMSIGKFIVLLGTVDPPLREQLLISNLLKKANVKITSSYTTSYLYESRQISPQPKIKI